MKIDQGYWNYYLTFAIKDYDKFTRHLLKRKVGHLSTAIVQGGKLYNNSYIKTILENRRRILLSIGEPFDVQSEENKKRYVKNELPEFYYDFSNEDGLNDSLENVIDIAEAEIKAISESNRKIYRLHTNSGSIILSLLPIKIYVDELEFIYARVYVVILESGIGVIKLSAELKNVDTTCLSTYPMKKWYKYIKLWKDNEFKIVYSDTEDISDIRFSLQEYIDELLGKHLVHSDKMLAYETFIVDKKDIYIKENGVNKENYEDLFYFANPQSFAARPNEKEIKAFFDNNKGDINGVQYIKGDVCRTIFYANLDDFVEQFSEDKVEDKMAYFQSSLQQSYDFALILALCNRENERRLYEASLKNLNNTQINMVKYLNSKNKQDDFLEMAPIACIKYKDLIEESLDRALVDVSKRVDRLRYIETATKEQLNKKVVALISVATFIITVIFGLPAINQTLMIIRMVLFSEGDILEEITTGEISLIIWLILVVVTIVCATMTRIKYNRAKNYK